MVVVVVVLLLFFFSFPFCIISVVVTLTAVAVYFYQTNSLNIARVCTAAASLIYACARAENSEMHSSKDRTKREQQTLYRENERLTERVHQLER